VIDTGAGKVRLFSALTHAEGVVVTADALHVHRHNVEQILALLGAVPVWVR
jgi:hypothetical protein